MPLRPNIGNVIRLAGAALQASAQQLAAGGVKQWMLDHREELLTVIEQARTERGAQLLHELCTHVPAVAGLVTMAMKGTPDMAIAAISFYSPELAEHLRTMKPQIAKLQEAWRLGAEETNNER